MFAIYGIKTLTTSVLLFVQHCVRALCTGVSCQTNVSELILSVLLELYESIVERTPGHLSNGKQ